MEIKLTIRTDGEYIDPPVFNTRQEAIEWLESATYLDEDDTEGN